VRCKGGLVLAKEVEVSVIVTTVAHPNPKSAIDLIANLVLKNALKSA
jgi:hypothetical protein